LGVFRTKPKLKWDNDVVEPKPSPTVMLLKKMYFTNEQKLSYKLTAILKNINKSFFQNPFSYLRTVNDKWNRSQYWENKLKNE
jgi:hypothetical protein